MDSDDADADVTVALGERSSPGSEPVLEPGARVSRYVILRPLARGGMGAVYLATDPDLDRRLAIKIVRPDGNARFDEDGGNARLLREAQAIARLSHPNVIAIYDLGTWRDGLFLAMEFVEGDDLRRWLRERQRSLEEILDVFIRFGRGLTAAHRAGIVHRDVKPANVLVTATGAVKVLDFGIARATLVPSSDAPVASGDLATTTVMQDAVTMAGRVMGTPIYMAPEQANGDAVTERCDIYSFCVALFEAVCGHPPFAGRTMGELTRARASGLRFPENRPIPKRLERILTRGLAHDPNDRFTDMDTLVRELESLRGRRAKIVRIAAVSAAAAVLFAVGGGVRRSAADDPCALADPGDVWGADRRHRIEESFAGSGLDLASHAWASVQPRIDGYVEAWVRARRDACEATLLRGEQTGAELDLRNACLDRARTRLEALLSTLESGESEALAGSIEGVGALPALEACGDLEALARLPPIPTDPDLRERVDEIRARLAELEANRVAGRYDVADTARSAIHESLRRVPDDAVRAEAAYEFARLDRALGRAAAGETELRTALHAAERSKHGILRARAALELADQLGSVQKRFAAAEEALHGADVMITGVGDPPELLARSRFVSAELLFARDQLDAAGEIYRALLEEDAPGLEADLLMLRIGDCLRGGRAIPWYERALALQTERFGPAHPRTAETWLSLARAQISDRDLDAGEASTRRALVVLTDVLGEDHPALAVAWSRLGIVELRRERYDRAAEYLEKAVAMITDDPRAIEFDGATILSNLGVLYGRRGEHERALATHRRALAMLERADPDHPRRSIPLINIASSLRAQGRPREAAIALDEVLGILRGLPGNEARAGDMERDLAETWLEAGEPTRAVPHAERALEMYLLHLPAEVTHARELLARAEAEASRVGVVAQAR